jgi:hypothetical protein
LTRCTQWRAHCAAEATHFIVLAGHEGRRVERLAFSNEPFLLVEKHGAAARDADPRS